MSRLGAPKHPMGQEPHAVSAKLLKRELDWPAPAAPDATVMSRSGRVVLARDRAVDPAALFHRHASYVAGVATRLLGRDHEVDDVVQDVFLIALRGLHALREPEAARAWLTKVAVRVAIRRLRWRRLRRTLGIDPDTGYDELPDHALAPEQRALMARIYALLDRLPAVDRVAWTLRHVEGQPAESVARMCGCSLATAKRRIGRVDQAVRQELSS